MAETMFGRPRADALGTNFGALFASAEERAALVASREKFIETGRPRPANRVRQLTALHSDGTEFPVELMVGDGRIDDEWHFFGFIRDISERKQADARLARAEKLEALGQLTGGIAHDFNNLLGIIVGNLDLALEFGRTHGETRKGLGIALSAAMRGKELIKSLLTVARRQVVVPEEENANHILTDMLPLLSNSAGPGVEVVLAPCEGPAMTMIERSGFEAALINLVVNARHAMPNGGTIRLTTAWHDVDTAFLDRENVSIKAGRYLVVSAHDNGVGMSHEVASRAFDPFFTTKDFGSADGSGLGLAMVYGFAKQSGGGATIESEPGRGTTVSLYLPAAEAVELAA